jgi:CARDB
MSERENDIEFDFFEEPDTRETAEERPRRRGPRPPVRPPTGLTPLLRLIGLICFAILIILLLVLWVNGCREDKRKDAYRTYVKQVSDYASGSQRLGRQFNTLLTSRGTKESDVESELAGLAGQQDQITNNARNLDPPGHLRDQDSHMLEAFELRANGLRGMSDAFRSTASSKNADAAGSDLAVQMQRFIASDVIWQDFFKEPTKEELQRLSVTGVNVPDSVFLRNPDIATSPSMKAVWQRIHGAATGGSTCSPRGTGLVSTTVLPAGKELSTGATNTIQQSTDLAFQVKVKNSGCAQEVGLKVTLTIQQSPNPIKSRKTIPLIDSGAEQTVEFRNLPLPPLDQKTSVTVEVDPVPGETKTDNNSASYPVQFSFG